MLLAGIDDKTWVSLSVQRAPFGSVIELTPEHDRVLRPVEVLTLSVMEGNHVLQARQLVDGQFSAWKTTIMDGEINRTIDRSRSGIICQHAAIRDDSLHGHVDILSCVRVTNARLVAATYEHVGLLSKEDFGRWSEGLILIVDRILASVPVGRISPRADRVLLPRLSQFLQKAQGPIVEQLRSYVSSARWSVDANAMSEGIAIPLLIMAARSAVHHSPPEDVQEEMILAAEHAALFGARSQQEGTLYLSLGELARFLVDDRLERLDMIDRGIRLSKYVCERAPDTFFEQSALSYILGLCRSAVKRDRDDVIETADWLIERLRKHPAMATRIIMRLLTKPPSLEGDNATQGQERLYRIDLAVYLLDTMDPISKDTSDQFDGGDLPLSTKECPPELPTPSDAIRFPAWPPDGAPVRWMVVLAGTESDLAQRAILGFETVGESDEVLNLPIGGMYFRAFRQTRRLRVRNSFVPDGAQIIPYPFEPKVLTFEAALYRSLMRKVRIFAVAGPHDTLGMGRVHKGELRSISKVSDWQSHVASLIGLVEFLVYLPDSTASLLWESSEIDRSGMTTHCVFVMLPQSVSERSEAVWHHFRQLNAPYCARLPEFDPKGAFVCFERDLCARALPFDALYDHRLPDLIMAISKPPKQRDFEPLTYQEVRMRRD